jgi:exodeoxyribonuclease V gamma subunit
VVHPLQPFSTRYFEKLEDPEQQPRLFSYASEWLEAHKSEAEATQNRALNPPAFEETPILPPSRLAGFLKQPAKLFFQERLKVRFERPDVEAEDAEPFSFDNLERYAITDELLTAARQAPDDATEAAMDATEEQLRRAGRIPAGIFGDNLLAEITNHARTTLNHWHALRAGWHEESEIREIALPLQAGPQSVQLEHWLTDLLVSGERHARILMLPNELDKKPWNALPHWLVHLFGCAGGLELTTVLISGDTRKALDPVPVDQARDTLEAIVQGWYQGQRAPLPLACKTAFTWLASQHKAHPEGDARTEYEGAYGKTGERDYTPELARSYDSFDAMAREQPELPGDFEGWTRALYEPLHQALRDLAEGETA